VAPEALWPVLRVLGWVYPPLLVQRTLFVGSPCAEHGSIGLATGVSLAEMVPALHAAVEARAKEIGARFVVWKDMPEPVAIVLRGFAPSFRWFEVPSFPGTVLQVGAGGFAGHLATLPSKRRHALKKKLRTSRAALALSVRELREPDEATIADVHRLYLMNYERATTRFERLTPAFFREVIAAAPSRLLLLLDDATQRPVAFMLYFMLGDHAINKFVGIDFEANPHAFLYFRLWEAFVERATAAGATTISSGQTSYRPKLDLGHELVPLWNFSKHFSPLLHRLYAAVGRRVTLETLDADLKTALPARRARGRLGP
jgi:hypothetical protein